MNTSAKTFIIVGASSGIGLALSRQLLTAQHKVIGICRSPGPLENVEGYVHYPVDLLNNASLPDIAGPVNGLAFCPGSITLKPFERLT